MIRRTFTAIVPLVLLFLPQFVAAQVNDAERKYTAYDMRSNGKIYVVVVVVLIILIGLLLYLVRIDRKIGKLEKELK
jgi:CcmD family protein